MSQNSQAVQLTLCSYSTVHHSLTSICRPVEFSVTVLYYHIFAVIYYCEPLRSKVFCSRRRVRTHGSDLQEDLLMLSFICENCFTSACKGLFEHAPVPKQPHGMRSCCVYKGHPFGTRRSRHPFGVNIPSHIPSSYYEHLQSVFRSLPLILPLPLFDQCVVRSSYHRV